MGNVNTFRSLSYCLMCKMCVRSDRFSDPKHNVLYRRIAQKGRRHCLDSRIREAFIDWSIIGGEDKGCIWDIGGETS